MKLNNLFSVALISGSAFVLASCSSEENILSITDNEIPVEVTVTVPTDETRTSLNEINGNLVWEWNEGDKLLVTTADGTNVGSLVVKSISENNPASATFSGKINGLATGNQKLTFHYLGKGQDPAAFRQSYEMNIASQSGNKNDLVKHDVLATTLDVNVNPNYTNIPDFSMRHYFGAAHFTLKFSDGRTLSGEEVRISGNNVYNAASIDLGKTGFSATEGTIVIPESNGDFYINVIPGQDVQFNFNVTTDDGIEWVGSFSNSFEVKPAEFYRNGQTLGGLVIEMKNTFGEPSPSNPGNIGNWGGDVNYPELITYPINASSG